LSRKGPVLAVESNRRDVKRCGMAVREEDSVEVQDIPCRPEDTISISIDPVAIGDIKEMAKELGFDEARLLRTAEIVTARWVGLKCRYGCANYNTSWCCPPASPNLDATRELLSEYSLALLLLGRSKNEHFYRNTTEKRRWQIRQWKATVALERKLFLMGYYKAFGLPADTCALCKKCSYPGRCKFPNEKRPSMEACSIDVFQTIRNLGRSVELASSVTDSYNSYSMILLV
jgi:predicted metal-binding protein